jgi:hypothetical protein
MRNHKPDPGQQDHRDIHAISLYSAKDGSPEQPGAQQVVTDLGPVPFQLVADFQVEVGNPAEFLHEPDVSPEERSLFLAIINTPQALNRICRLAVVSNLSEISNCVFERLFMGPDPEDIYESRSIRTSSSGGGAALIALTVVAHIVGLASATLYPLFVTAVSGAGYLAATAKATPILWSLRTARDEEHFLKAKLDRFAYWHGWRTAFQITALVALLWALASASPSDWLTTFKRRARPSDSGGYGSAV